MDTPPGSTRTPHLAGSPVQSVSERTGNRHRARSRRAHDGSRTQTAGGAVRGGIGFVRYFVLLCVGLAARAPGADLPAQYFRLLEAGVNQVDQRLTVSASADLKTLEAGGHEKHLFPHMILAAAVLYVKQDPANHRYRDKKLLSLA